MNKYWEADTSMGSLLGIVSKFVPLCPFHPKIGMYVINCKVFNFSLRNDENLDSHAIDVALSCPECGYLEVFGVPITQKHYTKVVDTVREYREKGIGVHETFERADRDSGGPKDNQWLGKYP